LKAVLEVLRDASPSLVSATLDDTVHIVEAVLTAQFNNAVQIVAFNLSEGWSRDVSEDIPRAVAALAREQDKMMGPGATLLYDLATGEDVPADVVEP
jgi:hypothetical protein